MGESARRCEGFVGTRTMERSVVKACERLESGDASLRELELLEVDARLVRALSRPSCLELVSLLGIELDRNLANALAKQTQLTRVELYGVRLWDGGASHLAAALHELTRLEEVSLFLPEVVEDDVECLVAAVFELPQLQTLALGGRAIAGSIRSVTEAVMAQGQLRKLVLDRTPIGDDGAEHLAAMLERNHSLSALELSCCKIGNTGLEWLGRALTRNTTLRYLDMTRNDFTADGVARFADMIGDMHGLQELELDDWEQQLLPGIERNYSLLLIPDYFFPAAQPLLARNACGYDKCYAATLAWLCVCRFHPPKGITRDIGLIIACHIYASRGYGCWADNDGDDGK